MRITLKGPLPSFGRGPFIHSLAQEIGWEYNKREILMEGRDNARNEKIAAEVPSALFTVGAALQPVGKSGKLDQRHAFGGTGG